MGGQSYDREILARVVAGASTLGQVIEGLGRKATPGRRSYVRSLARGWGISLTHLEREGVRHTEARLREAVGRSSSVMEVVHRLGLAPVGGNHAHISRRITTLGIDTSHFRAPRGGRSATKLDVLVVGRPQDGRVPGQRLRRELLRRGVLEVCSMCGTGTEWNGKPLRLEVDHVDGHWWDNRVKNLRLLCPNCHAVTDTYRGRKRGPRPQEDPP